MSEDSSEVPKYSAYDHLKKDASKKAATQGAASSTPAALKVFLLTIILFGALLASGVLTGPGPFDFGSNDNDNKSDPTDIIQQGEDNSVALNAMCVTHTNDLLHYHYYVTIFVNGQEQPVPANIGIPAADCYRPIHTHDGTGKVHVELPSSYDGGSPTLGDFFSIWGYPLNGDQLLGETGSVSLVVNNQEKSGQIQYYIPANNDQIILRLT